MFWNWIDRNRVNQMPPFGGSLRVALFGCFGYFYPRNFASASKVTWPGESRLNVTQTSQLVNLSLSNTLSNSIGLLMQIKVLKLLPYLLHAEFIVERSFNQNFCAYMKSVTLKSYVQLYVKSSGEFYQVSGFISSILFFAAKT